MCDFVVPGIDGVHGPNARWNVAVDVQPELVRLADARGEPRRVEGAVELDSGKAIGFRFVHERNGLGLAGRDVGHLRGVRSLAVDERGWIDVRRQEGTRGHPAPAVHRPHVVVTGVAHRRHTHRQLLQSGEVVADVHVAVPHAGDQGLAAPVDHLRTVRHHDRLATTNGFNCAFLDDHCPVGHEPRRVGVEEPDTRERNRSGRHGDQGFDQPRRLRRHGFRLRLLDFRLFAGIRVRQPGEPEGHAEKFVVRVGPHRQRRGADAGDCPERDGLCRRAGADFEIDQFGSACFAAGQEVERLVRPRQQRLQEPRRHINRSTLRHVERGDRITRNAGVDGALPTCRPTADGEGFGRVALRRHAADRDG